MARYRTARRASLFLVVYCVVVGFSNGLDDQPPLMKAPPLLNYGINYAGDTLTTFTLAGKSGEINLNFNVSYFGSSYNTLYISHHGFISFAKNMQYLQGVTWSEGIWNQESDLPFMAPFYHEGRNPYRSRQNNYPGKIFYRVIYADELQKDDAKENKYYSDMKYTLEYYSKYVQEAMINAPKDFSAKVMIVVTWSSVTDEAEDTRVDDCTSGDGCKSATFQAVIIADKVHTFTMFNYEKMEIPFNKFYQAGFNGGYGRGWYNVIPCHGACTLGLNKSRVNDLPELKGTDLQGRYFLNVGGEEIVRGGCLPNTLNAGMLEVYPRNVGMFGGERLEVSGKCLKATSKIYCRFGSATDSPVTTGSMSNDMKGYCPVPMMTNKGQVLLQWSIDGEKWTSEKHINVVLPDRLEPTTVNNANMEDWYAKDSTDIKVGWTPESLSANPSAMVDVKLWGYRETGGSVEFKELENFGTTENSAGLYTFQTDDFPCTRNCKDFEMGLLEVELRKEYFGGAVDRVAFRYGPITLGWYINKQLTEDDGSDWSNQMCRRWNSDDKQDMQWLDKLPKCPCSLDQVLADFGRWQADPGCDVFNGHKCVYHKEAIHCARSVQPTRDGAGNQCCYNSDKELIYSQLSYKGSTPDRGHNWGAFPYNVPDRVPILSHFKHDVVPFYHCCLWNEYDLCDLYMEQRPTTDCAHYEVPGLAFLRGDPHITTFDGLTYNFHGRGDFWLVDLPQLSIQGRFDPKRDSWDLGSLRKDDKTSWKPTALTHLAIQGAGEIVEIHLASENAVHPRVLDVRVGQSRHFFTDHASRWQDFQGQSIVNNNIEDNLHSNFTIITNGVGINVVGANHLLHVTVALSPSMKHNEDLNYQGMGLMGMFDGNRGNDLVSRSNTVSSPDTANEKFFKNFGMSWAVQPQDTLFPFIEKASDFSSYVRYYEYDQIPHDFKGAPTDSQISSTCEKDELCKWDYRITGSQKVAMATKNANRHFAQSQGSAYLVQNCGLPSIGKMAVLDSYNFSAGEEITVTDCGGDYSFGGETTFKCVQERMEETESLDWDGYGRLITDNKIDYVVHWVPEPHLVCSIKSEEPKLGMIIGIAVGAVAVIVIVIIIIVFIKKRKSKDSKNVNPRSADRVRRGTDPEEGSHEPMMSRDRDPVYKPSPSRRTPESSAV